MNNPSVTQSRWNLRRHERISLLVTICALVAFGILQERRTALRHAPMTDLGVFCIASGAIWSGQNPYAIPDWHGWHYQYPPALAILFLPLAEPVPLSPPILPPGELKTVVNTPWGYPVDGKNYYGFHAENTHFFFVVAAWYILSVLGILLSAHALACALEGAKLHTPPPEDALARRRWWWRRLLPLAVCAGSLATDLSRGQADILMLTAIALGVYLISTRANFKAGLCFAFPATVKLFPPLLLAYPFIRRQWNMALGVVAGLFILLAVLPLATLGPKRTTELYQCWIEVLAKPALGHGTDTSRLRELTGMGSTDNQSLLATLHNWTHHSLPRDQRPAEAAPWERNTVYAVGALMIIATLCVTGFRRTDSPHELLAITGLLVGIALVASPIVHNFYYLLMLPLVSVLIDLGLPQGNQSKMNWKLLLPVVVFMLGDLLARLPGIGRMLRDNGVTTVSLLWLLAAGTVFLAGQAKLHRTPAIIEAPTMQ
ncbi:MAG: glycosyltransferase family 87 protein [Verrucomicrobiae bacterium]|nr:glycosyltransferase family 87 protein [Verrucomicrobiae bacterium]